MTERVAQSEVAEYWIERDVKSGRKPPSTKAFVKRALKSGQIETLNKIWKDYGLKWRFDSIDSREEFLSMRLFLLPPLIGWPQVINEPQVSKGLEAVLSKRTSPKYIADIDYIFERVRNGSQIEDPLIIVKTPNHGTPIILDGKHRALAEAIRVHEGKPFSSIPVYIGTCQSLVCEKLFERSVDISKI